MGAAGLLRAQDSEDSLADQITAELEAGRLDAALDKAHSAVEQYPKASHFQQLLGVVLFKKGLNEDARTAFRLALELDPSVPQNYFDLGLVDLAEKRYPDAAQRLGTYLRLIP